LSFLVHRAPGAACCLRFFASIGPKSLAEIGFNFMRHRHAVARKYEILLLLGMDANVTLRKGVKTRQIFMDAARLVFVRDGYLNAEISEIAKAAGKSNGTFYIYFENKSALLDALIEEFHAHIDARFQEHDEQWYAAAKAEVWDMIIKNMWDTFKLNAATFHALSQASQVDEHFAAAYVFIRERTRLDFANFLKARQKLGFCKSLNIHYAAEALETMSLYCMNEWLAAGGKCHDRREEKKALSTLTAIFDTVMSCP
jgi:AcrR family transcriptional regulator